MIRSQALTRLLVLIYRVFPLLIHADLTDDFRRITCLSARSEYRYA